MCERTYHIEAGLPHCIVSNKNSNDQVLNDAGDGYELKMIWIISMRTNVVPCLTIAIRIIATRDID